MRRWQVPKTLSWTWRPCRNCAQVVPFGGVPLSKPVSVKALSTASNARDSPVETILPRSQYAVFDKIEPPTGDADAWVGLLDGALPPHLRQWTSSPPNLSAVDLAEILLAAQYPRDKGRQPLDLLFHLGFEQSRWIAVVWLVKKLIERFPARHRHGRTSRLAKANALWDKVEQHRFKASMNHSSAGALELSVDEHVPQGALLEARNLDELTAGAPENLSPDEVVAHRALGQIWRTLGAMIKACAGGEIKQEVLEIIAYLHHKEIMPLSIYKSESLQDKTAVQQPPLISVLSSRILTSLSDAAWRAHEKLVVEEAKANGGGYASLRPELPATAYRIHVAGLRPEVWLELILWSCIHGGWTSQGAEILYSICADKTWRPLSWREYEKQFPQEEQSSSRSWSTLEHMFKTRASFTPDAASEQYPEVTRTVSAEVVNAYVDALASNINVGVGSRGTDVKDILAKLHLFKNIFHRQTRDLALSFATWDAVALRVLDTQSVVPERDVDTALYLAALSLGFGSSLDRPDTQDLPDYVLDGTAATQGLLHRVLRGQIAAGSIEGALRTYRQLQKRADDDKMRSLYSFMASQKASMKTLITDDMFTSNFNGIEFPAFGVQIPSTILGSFLALVTDAKQFEFGRWLLYNDDVDGPVIGESLYSDPFVQPAVIRFAAETDDKALLSKFKNRQLVLDAIRASFDSQVNAMNWDAASRILRYLKYSDWNAYNLANVARVMLLAKRDTRQQSSKSDDQFEHGRRLFEDMLRGRHQHDSARRQGVTDESSTQSLLAILSAVGPAWADVCIGFCKTRGYREFDLQAEGFNLVLSGVVSAYGSAAGKRLLDVVWPHSARNAYDAKVRFHAARRKSATMPRYRPNPLNSVMRQRLVLRAPNSRDDQGTIVLYGALAPNAETILIVLRKAMEELQASSVEAGDKRSVSTKGAKAADVTAEVDARPREMVEWGVRRLAELPFVDGSIVEELDRLFTERGMHALRNDLVAIATRNGSDLNEGGLGGPVQEVHDDET